MTSEESKPTDSSSSQSPRRAMKDILRAAQVPESSAVYPVFARALYDLLVDQVLFEQAVERAEKNRQSISSRLSHDFRVCALPTSEHLLGNSIKNFSLFERFAIGLLSSLNIAYERATRTLCPAESLRSRVSLLIHEESKKPPTDVSAILGFRTAILVLSQSILRVRDATRVAVICQRFYRRYMVARRNRERESADMKVEDVNLRMLRLMIQKTDIPNLQLGVRLLPNRHALAVHIAPGPPLQKIASSLPSSPRPPKSPVLKQSSPFHVGNGPLFEGRNRSSIAEGGQRKANQKPSPPSRSVLDLPKKQTVALVKQPSSSVNHPRRPTCTHELCLKASTGHCLFSFIRDPGPLSSRSVHSRSVASYDDWLREKALKVRRTGEQPVPPSSDRKASPIRPSTHASFRPIIKTLDFHADPPLAVSPILHKHSLREDAPANTTTWSPNRSLDRSVSPRGLPSLSSKPVLELRYPTEVQQPRTGDAASDAALRSRLDAFDKSAEEFARALDRAFK